MPIDYSKYPANWKTEIRPAILERAKHCCEECGVPNHKDIFRGFWDGCEVYQDADGNIYDSCNSELLSAVDFETCIEPLSGKVNQMAIKVVLTIAHLDHDIQNNDSSNLKALCQLHHNRHDVLHRKQTRMYKKGQQSLF